VVKIYVQVQKNDPTTYIATTTGGDLERLSPFAFVAGVELTFIFEARVTQRNTFKGS
jgi:hypothetical protein